MALPALCHAIATNAVFVVPSGISAGTATNIARAVSTGGTWKTNALSSGGVLAVEQGTSYYFAGSGTLALGTVSNLTAAPVLCVSDGFDALTLPESFTPAGAGSFRAGHVNFFSLWATPMTNFVNYLYAQ